MYKYTTMYNPYRYTVSVLWYQTTLFAAAGTTALRDMLSNPGRSKSNELSSVELSTSNDVRKARDARDFFRG